MSTATQEKQEIVPLTPAVNALTPMEMLDRAVQSGASIETLDKLMSLQERWEKNQARKEFDQAVADAKLEIKPILKNRTGHNNKKYADFAAIATAIDPIISKYGLSYRFRSEQSERINVTCVLSHRSGHYEETTLSGPADTTGNKNAIQAIGSTLTYLQRYSLVQALGLAAADDDDGEKGGIGELITEAQALELTDLCEAVGADRAKFLKYLKIESLDQLPAKRFADAKAALEAKRAKS